MVSNAFEHAPRAGVPVRTNGTGGECFRVTRNYVLCMWFRLVFWTRKTSRWRISWKLKTAERISRTRSRKAKERSGYKLRRQFWLVPRTRCDFAGVAAKDDGFENIIARFSVEYLFARSRNTVSCLPLQRRARFDVNRTETAPVLAPVAQERRRYSVSLPGYIVIYLRVVATSCTSAIAWRGPENSQWSPAAVKLGSIFWLLW